MVGKKRAHNPEDFVDELLSDPGRQYVGGHPCLTCGHPKRKEIERASLHLLKLRTAGNTAYPWATFVRKELLVRYDYRSSTQSLKRHLERCLDKTIV